MIVALKNVKLVVVVVVVIVVIVVEWVSGMGERISSEVSNNGKRR